MSATIAASEQARHETSEHLETPDIEMMRQPTVQNSPSQMVQRREVVLRYWDNVVSSTRNFWSYVCNYKLEVVGWVAIIIGVIALLPGFRSQDISEMALDLTEWTALKDYVEYCQELKVHPKAR